MPPDSAGDIPRDQGRTPAAVLVPVFRDRAGELRIVLVVRGDRGFHAGQVGLPGGRWEPADGSYLQTALRETEEETGLQPAEIDVVAGVPPMDTRTTGFGVYPFVARIRPPARWRLAAGEIVDVVTPRVSELATPGVRREHLITLPHWPSAQRVDAIPLDDGRMLWGLTLRLLDVVVPRLLAGEWSI